VVPLVVKVVTKEEIASGEGRELVGSCGGSVGIAGITEHMNVFIGGGCAIQGKLRSGMAHLLRGETIDEMCSGV
jgi:hypothetical protein